MNNDPPTTPRDFSEALQQLRDELRRDVRGLADAIEQQPKPRSGISPLALVAGVLGALFVGAAGMSWYDANWGSNADSAAKPVDLRSELQTAMSPYTQQLEQTSQALLSAQQAVAEDLKAHGQSLDRLSESVANLQTAGEVQTAAFQERVDLLADELAAKIARPSAVDGQPTIAARPQLPKESAVQPANAESAVGDGLVEVEKRPAASTESAPERGELVINNPSEYDLKLLINGQQLDIKARGATTIDVTVGTVKTQIASVPDLVQTWNDWKAVDGVKRLTINVESSPGGLYQLK